MAANIWRLANREKHDYLLRKTQLKRKYGLTIEEYNQMAQEHDHSCAICRRACKTGRQLAVDHCHKTGTIRGLLCQSCNIGLGRFDDNPALLDAAKAYLLQSQLMGDKIGVIHRGDKSRTIPDASERAE